MARAQIIMARRAHLTTKKGSETLRKYLALIIITAAITATVCSSAGAATYYLDAANGNDIYDGLAQEWDGTHGPWKTMDKAQSTIQAGDAVLLQNGNYGDVYFGSSSATGTADNWITYKADDGETPVFETVELEIGKDAYLKFQELTLVADTSMGFIIRPETNYVWIYGCDISHTSFDPPGSTHGAIYGVWASDAFTTEHITIENCEIHHTYRGINVGGDYWTVKNNRIHEVIEDGIHGGTGNILIEDNEIWDVDYRPYPGYDPDDPSTRPHSDFIQWVSWSQPDNVVFRRNRLGPGLAQGLFLEAQGGSWSNVTVENNLIYGIPSVSSYLFLTGVNSGHIYNNTVIKTPGYGGATVALYGNVDEMYNNIFTGVTLGSGTIISHGNNIFGHEPSGFSKNSTEEIEDMDNLFADMDGQDYNLVDASLAIDFGNPDYGPDTDLLGNPRDAQPDAGCYEFTGSITTYTITAGAGEGGFIAPTGEVTVAEGRSRNFNIEADTGYHIDDVLVDGVSQGAISSYSFTNISADHTISAGFGVSPTHTITATTGTGGSISPSGEVIVTEGNNQTFMISPDLGYKIDDVLVDSASQGAISSHIFTSVISDHTIEATFDISDPNDALVGCWRFDEGVGTTAQDSSGSGNTATLVNGPIWTIGRINGGLSFDGVDDAVQIGTGNLNVSSGAIAFWAYAENFADSTQFLFGHATQPWANRIQLYTNDTSGSLGLGLGDSHTRHQNIQNLNTNTWYHVTLTWHGTNYVVYVDGQAKANGTYTGLSVLGSYADIGNNGNSSERNEGFNGLVDEVHIYNRALSATEVQAVYNEYAGTPETYTLNIAAVNGSVTKDPDETYYDAGQTVELQAIPDTGYHFVNWSGDASGTSNPAVITMNANKSVTANFAINTYSLNINTNNGSVTKTPNQTSYNYGQMVSLLAAPDGGYHFTSWSGDASGTSNPVAITMTSNKSVTAGFEQDPDNTAPTVAGLSPEDDAVQVPLNNLVQLHLVDNGSGVNADLVTIMLDGELIYTSDTSSYQSATGRCYRLGSNNDFTFVYQADELFDFDQQIQLAVSASDVAGNPVSQSWSFRTQMRSFGANKSIASDTGVDRQVTATATDSSGNVWAVWHEGQTGSRNIRLAKLADGEESFSSYVELTNDSYDQCNADIAIGANNKLYVVWQGDNSGSWDVYISTSTNWSIQRQVTDSTGDEVNPVVAVDGSEPENAYVVWEDDRNGNGDIYAAGSSNDFQNSTPWAIATEQSEQSEPAIAIDADDTVYIVWTDHRQGNDDIYGASSDGGSWTNYPVVSRTYNQSSPAVAVEDSGSRLHLLWADDRGSDYDIYYAHASDGIPDSPIDGENIVDDTTNSDQLSPVIAVIGSISSGLCVFACWQDERNSDSDLYFVQVGSASGTNIFIGDRNTNSDQDAPAMALDGYGYPYVVWTDDRNGNLDIYYAASTYMHPQALAQEQVSAGSEALVGPSQISEVDDVSIDIPAGACSHNVNVKISKMQNMPVFAQCIPVANYDMGPSGITFNEPVTIIIPYDAVYQSALSPYYYEPQEDNPSQNGITNIEWLELPYVPDIYAIKFDTSHFSQFFLAAGTEADEPEVLWKFGTYDDQKNARVNITDGDGNPLALSLRGGGYGEVIQEQDSVSLELYDTTDRSSLKISAKDRSAGGTIGGIVVNGSLRQISAKGIDIEGDITVTGSLGKVILDDVSDSIITVGPTSNPRTNLTFKLGRVSDSNIFSQTPIKSLTAVDWRDTDSVPDRITTYSIRTLKTSGDRRNNVDGDFWADLVLTAATNDPLKASIAGDLLNADWRVNGDIKTLVVKGASDNSRVCCTGSILTITLGAAYDSDFLAGFDLDFGQHGPDSVSDFRTTNAQIKSFTVKGLKSRPGQYYFVNSNVSAPSIGRVKLVNLKTQNLGDGFGFCAVDTDAGNDLASVTNKSTISENDSFTAKQGDGIPGTVEDFCMQILQP